MQNHTFQLTLDGVPYIVKATAFSYNEGTRYSISYNESSDFIFAWDSEASQYRAIDDDSTQIPANVETAISAQLLQL